MEPPRWELENRPVSDARVLASMDFAGPRNTYKDFTHMTDGAFGTDNLSTQRDDIESRRENPLTRQRNHSFRHKSEFEETVRVIIEKGGDGSGFANQHRRQVSSSSTNSSLAHASRSMLLMRNAATPGSSTSQLNLANTVKENGEVEVAGGVAVREEGVNMGSADIITQA